MAEHRDPLPLGTANEPMLLGEERVELRRDDGSWASGTGRTSLELLPQPSIRCRIAVSDMGGDERLLLGGMLGPGTLHYPDRAAHVAVRGVGSQIGEHTVFTQAFGPAAALVTGQGDALSLVAFRVMNFPEFRWLSGRGPNRIAYLEADGWQVALYPSTETTTNHESLKNVGGHAFTHLGAARRSDGGTFTAAMFDELETVLHYFLSFAAGAWATPMLPVGYKDGGRPIWAQWRTPVTGRWSFMVNWFGRKHPAQLTDVFPGFFSLCKTAFWQMQIRKVVSYYVGSNQQLGTVEASLILSFAALELLAWVTLVEDWQTLTKTQYDKLRGGQRLEALLTELEIPTDVPFELRTLAPLARAEKWSGPKALNAMRNSCVHPQTRDAASTADEMAKVDVWQLSLWYIELVLLRLCDYKGSYYNRLRHHAGGRGQDQVPWTAKWA